MVDTFGAIVLGHMTGDYLLQSNYMAIHKADRTNEGALACLLHCALYTLSVCLFLWRFDPLIMSLVFMSHWPIDRLSLAKYWLKFIGSRDVMAEFKSTGEYRDIALSFACLVYAAADNTMHLILLWFITKLL